MGESNQLCSSQHAFLANTRSNVQFIALLGSRQSGHTDRYANDDADTYVAYLALSHNITAHKKEMLYICD